ncbi:MAG TPA: choice-of-anchor I family protein [Thermodesulfobacteriota bacterium]|nr:choice-of-anchor I family protein [Thermodesulfobacteriota bacterium]
MRNMKHIPLALLLLLGFNLTAKAEISLSPIGTYATGVFAEGASEIVAHDPVTQRVFVINADASVVDVLDISDPTNPTKLFSIDVTDNIDPNGGINSVDVKNGIVAIAVENDDPTQNGFAAFYNTDGTFLNSVGVGVLPDALKFSNNGNLVLVSNEGEPVEDDEGNLVDNPKGSVSIIDVSSGVQNAFVTNLDFTGFDGREAEFVAKGLKLQPGVPFSREVEPEFGTFSPDGTQAFVTLQEANGFAVINTTNPQAPFIVDVLPLGFKDHGKGQPKLNLFPFVSLPRLGTDATGLRIKLGGFSGIWFDGKKNKNVLRFITVPDRGPNGSDVVAGARTFNLPDYQARIVFFDVNLQSGKSVIKSNETILLKRDGNVPITGLPNIPGFDEVPVDAAGNPLPYDPFGADIEGVVRDPKDNSFWMVDEYRPAIYHFSPAGVLLERLVPINTHLLGDSTLKEQVFGPEGNTEGFYGLENLPEVYNKRRGNRGFEAVALDTEKRILYAFIQSPLDNPDSSTRSSLVLRILGVDVSDPSSPTYLKPISEYVYLLEGPTHILDIVDKIGDAVFIGNDKFLVIERDSAIDPRGKKFVYEVDLKGATNIRGLAIADEMATNTLEQTSPNDLPAMGIIPVNKIKVLNLPSIGYLPSDKPEGITILPDGTIAVLNDNDFGIEGSAGLVPVLGLISFKKGNRLDASDKDGVINLKNWPVFGMYQPDTIASFQANGMTYYVTANEGDTRDFEFFSEEERIEDLTLDPTVFTDAAQLQDETNLGRLKITNILGDLDKDGIFDKLFSFGARSFSIWDSFGNLVFDSGDDFEKITAFKLPVNFNSDNEDNDSFDSRSDDKGPEPEAIAVGKIGSKSYAFIGLERIGGIMVYEVTNPKAPRFIQYLNNRNFNVDAEINGASNPAAGDLGPESIIFISQEDSPNGKPLLVVGNEISGTTTVYSIKLSRK